MKKKVSKKVKKKTNRSKTYHLLVYVLDSSSRIKRFDSTLEMGKFIDDFNKQYPEYSSLDSDNWIDFCVEGVTGPVHFFTDGLEVE